jgi:hypothetical protein
MCRVAKNIEECEHKKTTNSPFSGCSSSFNLNKFSLKKLYNAITLTPLADSLIDPDKRSPVNKSATLL